MKYIAFFILFLSFTSCRDNPLDQVCSICKSELLINGEPWEVIDRNMFRETVIDGESFFTIGLNTRRQDSFMFIKDVLSISGIYHNVGDSVMLVDRQLGQNIDLARFTYLTSKSDGDVQGSFYNLDTSYNNFVVLEEVTELYLKANFQAKLLKVIPENDPWPDDSEIIEFTNAKIIASREE